MGLKVIGTGFGRTGTDSMREALNLLGFGPCHHMVEVDRDPEQKRLWGAVARGAAPHWERLFEGYASCVDFPSAFYWRELLAAYPEAKAILTWRPAEDWWASWARSVGPVIRDSVDPESLGVLLIAKRLFGGRPLDRDHVMAIYEAHVAEVQASVPSERLLIHQATDGWPPLCAHLGVETPDVPYPHRNTSAEFEAELARLRGMNYRDEPDG
jgi:hypothetical protein